MKKIVSQIMISIALVIFIFSSAGFAIHSCSCEGVSKIMLLSDTSFELIKTKCCNCEHHHHKCSHNHNEGCCHTEIIVLEEAFDFQATDIQVYNNDYILLPFMAELIQDITFPKSEEVIPSFCPPDILYRDRIILDICQLRI